MDINRYLNLITSQHREQPKFISWVAAPITIIDDTTEMYKGFDAKFDLDDAVGDQLDKLGEIVGVSRIVNFQPADDVSPVMLDETYRLMIKAKIAKNQWDGTIPGLLTIWKNIFPEIVIIIKDNQNMTTDITLVGLGTPLQRELVANGYIIPKPQGVHYNYYFTDNIIFGFGIDNEFFSGFGVGYWL